MLYVCKEEGSVVNEMKYGIWNMEYEIYENMKYMKIYENI